MACWGDAKEAIPPEKHRSLIDAFLSVESPVWTESANDYISLPGTLELVLEKITLPGPCIPESKPSNQDIPSVSSLNGSELNSFPQGFVDLTNRLNHTDKDTARSSWMVLELLTSTQALPVYACHSKRIVDALFLIFKPGSMGNFKHFRSLFIFILNNCVDIVIYLLESDLFLQMVWHCSSPEIQDCLVACFVLSVSKDTHGFRKKMYDLLVECDFWFLLMDGIDKYFSNPEKSHISISCSETLQRIYKATAGNIPESYSMYLSTVVSADCHESNSPMFSLISEKLAYANLDESAGAVDSFIDLIHMIIILPNKFSTEPRQSSINCLKFTQNQTSHSSSADHSSLFSNLIRGLKLSSLCCIIEILATIIPDVKLEADDWDMLSNLILGKYSKSSILQASFSKLFKASWAYPGSIPESLLPKLKSGMSKDNKALILMLESWDGKENDHADSNRQFKQNLERRPARKSSQVFTLDSLDDKIDDLDAMITLNIV